MNFRAPFALRALAPLCGVLLLSAPGARPLAQAAGGEAPAAEMADSSEASGDLSPSRAAEQSDVGLQLREPGTQPTDAERYGVTPRQLRRGRILAASAVALLYTGLWTYNYFAWWHNAELTPFQTEWDGFFGVDTYGGGADKMGHLYMNLMLSRATTGILRYGRFDSVPASIAGATLSWLSYLFVEIRDGAHVFEFSWGDLLANTMGVALGLVLTHVPVLDRFFSLRMMYWPSTEFRESPSLNFNEDYTGQTFIAAFHLAGFGDRVGPFRYIDLVVGFNAEHYLPNPTGGVTDRNPERQHLFFGFALNLQEVLNQLFFRDHPRERDSRAREFTRGLFVDWAAEHVQLPFTAVPLVQIERTNPNP